MEGLPDDPVRRRRPAARGRPALTRRLVLLRHGRTAHNAEGRIQGQLDVPLDGVGLAQAEALGAVFAAAPPAVVVSSDLQRAQQTAQAVCDHVGLPLQIDPRLREQHYGRWQGLTADEAAADDPEAYVAWRSNWGTPPEGESWAEVGERAVACASELLLESQGDLLLVTHGGTARCLVGELTGQPVDEWWRMASLGNTCWATLVEHPRGWRVERHNTGLGPLVGAPTGFR